MTSKEKLQRGCLAIVFVFLILSGGLCLFVASSVHTLLRDVRRDLPQASSLAYFEPSQTTRIFASNGQLIATLYRENRTWMPLGKISPWVPKAAMAIEDTNFYAHRGIDPRGVARAIYQSLTTKDRQGASTITMQLARNIFLTRDQTWNRKIKEVLLAIEIEKSFTKDEIMEMYLNQIYLGSGAYGVQAAASLYFNKNCRDLTPAQSAILAGLPQSPNEYSPLRNEAKCKERAREVLGRMVAVGYITPEQHGRALTDLERIRFHNRNRDEFQVLEVPYFTTYVIKELYKRFDEDTLYRGGLRVYTTVDLDMQRKAEKILRELVTRDAEYLNVHAGALVCIENKTGYIKTMVGGLGWTKKNQFNRAWQARRQPGSSFKPFVYATALECGLTPDSVVPDSPLTVDGWTPKNSDGRFMGSISLAVALQNSRNVVSVRLAQITGLKRIVEYAHACGIIEELPEFLSLALGSCEVPPLQMAAAYTVFPNAGLKVEASPIKLIKDAEGRVVEDNRVPQAREVFSEPTACNMVDMMTKVVSAGTATNAYMENHEVAGKTGTTDSFRDAWFNGYTSRYTTAVWVGNDDYSRMWTSFGGDLPARIWREFMAFAERKNPPSRISRTRTHQISCLFCAQTNDRAGPGCPKVFRKLLGRYDLPRHYCSTHGAPVFTATGASSNPHYDRPASSQRSEAGPAAPQNSAPVPYDESGVGSEAAPVPQQVQIPSDMPPEPAPVAPEPAPVDIAPPPEPEPAPVPVEVPLEAPPPPPPAPEGEPQ